MQQRVCLSLQPARGSLQAAALPQDGAICPQLRNLDGALQTVNLKQRSEYSKDISCFWMCLNRKWLIVERVEKREDSVENNKYATSVEHKDKLL